MDLNSVSRDNSCLEVNKAVLSGLVFAPGLLPELCLAHKMYFNIPCDMNDGVERLRINEESYSKMGLSTMHRGQKILVHC